MTKTPVAPAIAPHGDAGHAAGFEPIRQIMQVLGERAKSPDGGLAGCGAYRRHVHGRSDIDLRRRRVDHLQVRVAAGRKLRHGISSYRQEGRGPCKSVIFLFGIATVAASPLSSAHQPMCHVF